MQLTTTIDTDREVITFCYKGVSLSVNRKAYETSADGLIFGWVCSNFDEDGERWLVNVLQKTCKQAFDNWAYVIGRF
nr:hypothetical protein [uncultured Ruegeria sp.]